MNVKVGDRWHDLIAGAVESGRFSSTEDLVAKGLRLMQERAKKFHAVRATIQASIAAGGSHTGEEVMAAVRERLDSLKLKKREKAA